MENLTLVSLFFKMIAYYEDPSRQSQKKKEGTLRIYRNKLIVLSEFLSENKLIKIKAINFDKKIAENYYNWLLSTKKYSNNYSVRCVQIVNAVNDFGVSKDLLPYNPLNGYKLKKTPPDKPTYFTPKQIELWENYNTDCEKKTKASHMAVIQIHTGFDYGDFKEVSRNHVLIYKGRKYLVKPRQKNGNEAIIPLTSKSESIFEFYNYKMNLLSNVEYNSLIKEIASDLKINIYLKSKSLRKVFLMDQLNNKGVAIEAVSKMAGHKRIRTTEETYAQVNINLISNELARLGV